MPLSPPAGYSSALKRPGVRLRVQLGASTRSAGAAARRLLLLGNRLATGTRPENTPVFVPSPDDARTFFGAGSELQLMSAAVFAQYGQPTLYACPVAENSAAVRATALLGLLGAPSRAGVVNLWVAGRALEELPVATTDTAASLAGVLAARINAKTDWPVTAAPFGGGVVTLSAKQRGPRGNQLAVYVEVAVPGMSAVVNGGAAVNGGDTRYGPGNFLFGRLGTGSATAGAGADDLQSTLDALFAKRFDRIVAAHHDSVSLTKLRAHLDRAASILEGRRQQAVVATTQDLATAIALATGQNAPRLQIAWHYNGENLAGEIAAQVAAARLYGDGAVGGAARARKGEEAYIAANLDGCRLASVLEQRFTEDQPLGTELEAALSNGLTPLEPSHANPGFTAISRSVTARSLDEFANPNYAVLDTSKVSVSDFVADDLEAGVANEFAAKNLAPDPPDGRGPETPDVVFPSMVYGFLATRLLAYQRAGLITGVQEHLGELLVGIDATNPALVVADIPADVVEAFHHFAGTVAQTG